MKKTVIILSVLAVIASNCGQARNKQAATDKTTSQNTTSFANDTVRQSVADNYTVEDTVRFQIGGKLYFLNIRPSDSITIIKTVYYQDMYREYHFIVHNRYSNAHRYFEASTLDSIYNAYMTNESYLCYYENYLQPQLDTVQSRRIDLAIKYFNGYWIYLEEYNGNYYLNDEWNWHPSFHIADSVFTIHYMDGPHPQKILEAVSLQGKGISILCDGDKEPVKIEVFDKSQSIYRLFVKGQIYFIAPARAIHNFEIIQYTNSTGDMIP